MKKTMFTGFLILLMFSLVIGCDNATKREAVFIEETETKSESSPVQEIATAAKDTATSIMKTQESQVPEGSELIVADFNSGEKPNNIGGNFGAWDKDPADFSQGCSESFDSANRYGASGFSMKLDYDVDSDNPAYNGFWMMLQNVDVSGYDNLAFKVKGDLDEGYTTVLKVELKNANRQVGRFYITEIGGDWKEIIIPLNDFKGINDFSNLTEFVIVFEDRIASNKDGVIYIDDIKFTKGT